MRSALCVGIDKYPASHERLEGCANDAKRWAKALSPPDPEMSAAHRATRKVQLGQSSEVRGIIGFQACSQGEWAYEEDGEGVFSRRALQVLAADNGSVTNRQFIEFVSNGISGQTPMLTCHQSFLDSGLLEPIRTD